MYKMCVALAVTTNAMRHQIVAESKFKPLGSMANCKTLPYVQAFFPYRDTAHRRADDIFAV
jgi:hypothetical protein